MAKDRRGDRLYSAVVNNRPRFPEHSIAVLFVSRIRTWPVTVARENGGYPVETGDNNNRRGSAGPISRRYSRTEMLEKRPGRARMSEEKRWREATRNFSSGILAALNGTSVGGHRGEIYIPGGRDIR